MRIPYDLVAELTSAVNLSIHREVLADPPPGDLAARPPHRPHPVSHRFGCWAPRHVLRRRGCRPAAAGRRSRPSAPRCRPAHGAVPGPAGTSRTWSRYTTIRTRAEGRTWSGHNRDPV